jgi:hypothetical protein
VYPNATWAGGYPGRTEDWAFTGTQPFSLYLVPETGTQIGACELIAEWDSAVVSLDTVIYTGSIFSGSNVLFAGSNRLGSGNHVTLNASLISPTNVTAGAGDYVARLDMRLRRPGHSAVSLIGSRITYFNPGSDPSLVYFVPLQAEVRTYLADVTAPGNGTTGDGGINFDDLAPWTLSYWSGVPPYGMTSYKAKFDFGPTQDGFIFSLPTYDQKIDFEDLMIFSISNGQSFGHELPKVMPQTGAVVVSLGSPAEAGGEIHLPVLISGGVSDIRALSLELSGTYGTFLGAEKGEMLQQYRTPVMVFSRSEGRSVFVDCAVPGLDAQSLNREGEVLVLRFAGTPSLALTRADCRTSRNTRLDVALGRGQPASVPVTYALEQNYPNPFNPVTTITFAIPARGVALETRHEVSLQVFDLLGRPVATLADGMYEAGMHAVRFDASRLSSGTYIYRLRVDDFTGVRRMLLLK